MKIGWFRGGEFFHKIPLGTEFSRENRQYHSTYYETKVGEFCGRKEKSFIPQKARPAPESSMTWQVRGKDNTMSRRKSFGAAQWVARIIAERRGQFDEGRRSMEEQNFITADEIFDRLWILLEKGEPLPLRGGVFAFYENMAYWREDNSGPSSRRVKMNRTWARRQLKALASDMFMQGR